MIRNLSNLIFVIFIRFDESLVKFVYYGVIIVVFSYIFVCNVGIMNKIVFRLLNRMILFVVKL